MWYRLRVELLESLSEQVHQAADELIALKKERTQLLSELELLRRQSQQFLSVLRENERLKRDQDKIRTRLLKMQKKIDRLMILEAPVVSRLEGGINNEEHPQ